MAASGDRHRTGPDARPIRKILVANRGEIARRVMRTCRDMGIGTVAVFSEPDRAAPFVAEADEAVALGGSSPAESYLRIDAIVEAARRTGAGAVHPGYGFLAENADFARRCAAAGLVFVGPSADAIAAMGSKIAARGRMRAAGVPVLAAAEASTFGDLVAAAEGIGWPVMVKASAGGGGKGMRVVSSPSHLPEALAAARREAASAFGDDTVFLERYVEGARHVEIQVLGDGQGCVVHLFERECSIQRRHQKILEESPSVAVDPALREAMGAAAVAAAKAVGYTSAGTVEFLLTPEREFFFLEMNTRLQVEHPITECVTGLDLVRLQILIAQGEPLPGEALGPRISGHAIEARLYAEDPERDFLPVTGTLHRFRIEEAPGIRVDSGVAEGSVVSVHYDPLLAKVIAHAPTRPEAAGRLAAALAGMRLHGVVTNRDLLVRLLRHPEFLEGATDTGFLERHPPAELGVPLASAEAERLHAASAALALAAGRRRTAPVLGFAPSGWRNNPSQLQQAVFEGRSGPIEVGYRWHRSGLTLRLGDRELAARLGECGLEDVGLEVDGVHRRYEVHRVGDVSYVDSPLGHTALREIDRFPAAQEAAESGSLVSPMPGVVLRMRARLGEDVEAGAVVAIIEAMKMEHPVAAPYPGRVIEIRVKEGQQVESGMVLAIIDQREASGELSPRRRSEP